MKETGIIMSGNHPKLILDGSKTQTRRVITPQPTIYTSNANISSLNWQRKPSETIIQVGQPSLDIIRTTLLQSCPYGQVGDRLWVRETHYIDYPLQDGVLRAIFKDGSEKFNTGEYIANFCNVDRLKWRPSIFMPRWASRILLEITEIRVERLQEITEADALAEGIKIMQGTWQKIDIEKHKAIGEPQPFTARYHYEALWDNLNLGRGYGWDTNPWVWVIEFKILET